MNRVVIARLLWSTRKRRVVTAFVLVFVVIGVNVIGTHFRDRAAYRAARAELERDRIDLHEINLAFEDKLGQKKFTGVETLTVTSSGGKMKHGLRRHLWTEAQSESGTTVALSFSPAEVWINGAPSKVAQVSNEGGFQVVSLGDPDVVLAPGVHQFIFRYESALADFMRADAREGFTYHVSAPIGFLTKKLRGSLLLPGYAKAGEVFAVGRVSARHPETSEVGATGEMLRVSTQVDAESKRVAVLFESEGEILPGGFGTIEVVW